MTDTGALGHYDAVCGFLNRHDPKERASVVDVQKKLMETKDGKTLEFYEGIENCKVFEGHCNSCKGEMAGVSEYNAMQLVRPHIMAHCIHCGIFTIIKITGAKQ